MAIQELGEHRRCFTIRKLACVCATFVVVAAAGVAVWATRFRSVGTVTMSFSTAASGRRYLAGPTNGAVNWTDSYYGYAPLASVESLQYFLTNIRLCTSTTITGSGFNGCEDEWLLFDHAKGKDLNFYNTFTSVEAMQDTDRDDYIDLMTADGRAKISAKNIDLPASCVGKSYKYALITWMRPVKAKVSIPIDSTTTLYSKSLQSTSPISDPVHKMVTVITAPMDAGGPTELTASDLPNGGSWSMFAQPFVPTAGNWKLDLAFNPDNIIKATKCQQPCNGQGSTNNNFPQLQDTRGNQIILPMIGLSPIPHKAGDTLKKEQYIISGGAGLLGSNSAAFDIRLELYFVVGQVDNVLATDSAFFSLGSNSGGDVQKTFILEGSRSGPYTFKDWSSTPWLANFNRLTSIGASSTCTFSVGCTPKDAGSAPNPNCQHVSVNYVLNDIIHVL